MCSWFSSFFFQRCLFRRGGILSFCVTVWCTFVWVGFVFRSLVHRTCCSNGRWMVCCVLFRLDTSACSVRVSVVVPRGPPPSRLLLLPSQRSMLVFGAWFPSALVSPSFCMAFFLCDDLLLFFYLASNSDCIGWLINLSAWYPLLSRGV